LFKGGKDRDFAERRSAVVEGAKEAEGRKGRREQGSKGAREEGKKGARKEGAGS